MDDAGELAALTGNHGHNKAVVAERNEFFLQGSVVVMRAQEALERHLNLLLLPLNIAPAIADYHHRRAETALATLDAHLARASYLCTDEPSIADLFCYGDVAFAEICGFDLKHWVNLAPWADKITALPGFKAPFDLLQMEDAEFP